MIYKLKDGTCVISSHDVWRPGSFESEEAASVGQRLEDGELQRLQDIANERGDHVITLADLQGLGER